MKLLITGGGTGGHVNPGLAIAKYVQSRRPDAEIRFAGTAAGIESRLVPREGYQLYTIDVRGLKRSLSPSAIVYNIATLQKSLTATNAAKKILREFQPDAVIGCGGYASFPMVRAAQSLHIPTVLLEVNALPGVVTKSCAKKADRVLISFENTRALLENRPNIHLTGAPVRGDIIFADRQKAREKLGLGEKEKLVVSFWGSLGAATMNERMLDFFAREQEAGFPFHHIHAAGKSDWPHLSGELESRRLSGPMLDVRQYIYDMSVVMAAADLVISRAGASTLSELTALGMPTILVPSPYVVANHQEKNARMLESHGGAVVLTEEQATGEALYQETAAILTDDGKRRAMAKAMAGLGIPDATERIYNTLMSLL